MVSQLSTGTFLMTICFCGGRPFANPSPCESPPEQRYSFHTLFAAVLIEDTKANAIPRDLVSNLTLRVLRGMLKCTSVGTATRRDMAAIAQPVPKHACCIYVMWQVRGYVKAQDPKQCFGDTIPAKLVYETGYSTVETPAS
ncbi:hypothetical protein FPV67DRAFT_641684 [Lyophyllum atratum]|nr:hypothetical protein FPV67DRAFT_641684 [Lyophyllum atratum]